MNWKNNYFIFLEIVFVLAGIFALLVFPKGELELIINQRITSLILDQVFKYFTHLGDGLIILPLLVSLLFIKYKYAAVLAISSLYQLILVNVNKRIIFSDVVRPKVFLEGHTLHLVDGVEVHNYNSFPSGHTTTAFAVFLLLSLIVKEKKWSVLFFILSLSVGFSRIYLLQHFFVDVYAGSIIGCLSTIMAWYTATKINHPKLEGKLG